MDYQVGTLLNINGMDAKVIGFIRYENQQDTGKEWTEYRLQTKKGECWLSCDDYYQEYSISWPANDIRGSIGPEWHKVDEGTQVVRNYGGDVDVDSGETASFIEYEDESEERTLSVEMWSDGTEYSTGKYIEKSEINEVGFEKTTVKKKNKFVPFIFIMICLFFFFSSATFSTIVSLFQGSRTISRYLEKSSNYKYETSLTGKEKQKAKVYVYRLQTTTDYVAKDIIGAIEGKTEAVTQKDDKMDEEIAILTKKEYCLVYHPEGEKQVVYIQISDRKYNYTSDNSPYRCSSANTRWYRSHYYSSGYASDAKAYKRTPSAYSMYSGDTIHNIGNGYFDMYSNSIRQSSLNRRRSSGGGLSSGK